MNMILLFQEDFIEQNKVVLNDRRHKHIIDILRSSVGQKLSVGLLNNKIGTGVIVKQTKAETTLEVILEKPPAKKLPLTLILCLCRPPVLRRVIYTCTILGVEELHIINSSRVEKSFWQSHSLEKQELDKEMYLGLEQSIDTVCPLINIEHSFNKFTDEKLANIIKNKKAIIVDPAAKKTCPYNVSESAVIAIGPEGGFLVPEVKAFKKLGFKDRNLGSRIQRVETVIPYVVGRMF
ncbi:MAG: 16S rRNA (uracil(1498)-N(3))-methyltransferase [Candidatus Omnitrophica bacterium]|nr:16S rRNA (uracil(1498)-N(3))-methyltransferase [Candidatus Omnitrophota bacterium]